MNYQIIQINSSIEKNWTLINSAVSIEESSYTEKFFDKFLTIYIGVFEKLKNSKLFFKRNNNVDYKPLGVGV